MFIRLPLNNLEQTGRHSQPRLVNSPVFGVDGEIIDMILRAGDVTEFVRLTSNELQRVTEDRHTRTEEMEAEIYHGGQYIQELNG